ncbi:MAG: 3-deoxy-D-manno-octulosonate 8-phosphate phosphatase [Myxococcota bacterium]
MDGVVNEDLSARATRCRLVLADCDGTLTDAGAWYTADGELAKRFSLRDGMGVELLRNIGVQTAIITRESSEPARRRAEKLKLPFHFDGIRDKRAHLPEIIRLTQVEPSEMGYIGDDVNDLDIMQAIANAGGLTGAPIDATHEVLNLVHHQGTRPGGHGAFREFAEWIISLRTGGV